MMAAIRNGLVISDGSEEDNFVEGNSGPDDRDL